MKRQTGKGRRQGHILQSDGDARWTSFVPISLQWGYTPPSPTTVRNAIESGVKPLATKIESAGISLCVKVSYNLCYVEWNRTLTALSLYIGVPLPLERIVSSGTLCELLNFEIQHFPSPSSLTCRPALISDGGEGNCCFASIPVSILPPNKFGYL